MKKLIWALVIIGVVLLLINILKIVGGFILLGIGIVCFVAAIILGIIAMAKGD